MTGPIVTIAALSVWAATSSATGQEQAPNSPTAAVTPFLDEQTIGVMRVDTSRLDLKAAMSWANGGRALPDRDQVFLADWKKAVDAWLAEFRGAGGRDFYVVLSLADDVLRGPFIVVPLQPESDTGRLERLFVTDPAHPQSGWLSFLKFQSSKKHSGAMLFGSDRQLERVLRMKAGARRASEEAFASVAGTAVQVLLLFNDDHRRVLSEFLRDPQAERELLADSALRARPAELSRDPQTIAKIALGDGLQWVALGVEIGGKPAARLVISSRDAIAAQALDAWIQGVWRFVKKSVLADRSAPAAQSAVVVVLIDQLAGILAPKVEGNRLVVRVDASDPAVAPLVAGVGNLVGQAMGTARVASVQNKLKELALAMHNFHDTHKRFPPAAIRDAQGRPLLSWRVSLLPELGFEDLYKEFHLNEPWDSEHNRTLISRMPEIFSPPLQSSQSGKTSFLAPVGKDTIFTPSGGMSIREITDGTSNTMMILDVGETGAVVWTKPEEFNVDRADLKQALFAGRDVVPVAAADGSARLIRPSIEERVLRASLTARGGEVVRW